jgi:hypothetical protein
LFLLAASLLKIKIMKITIKKQVETETDFPTPSFWKSFGSSYMVTEKNIVRVFGGTISCVDSSTFKDYIVELINTPAERISEQDFFRAYLKANETINQAIQTEQEV